MGRTSKDKRDIYYRKAKAIGYRARSAFKLEQLDTQCNLLGDATNIVDLCAAPGSWSQYIARRLKLDGRSESSRVIAIDLQEMAPIEGVHIIQADITKESTLQAVRDFFHGGQADIVLSDGAPDVTGLHDVDEYVQAQLVLAALNVAIALLKPGGSFVAKVFRQKDTDLLYTQLRTLFRDVSVVKPRSSRSSSIEAFVVCQKYHPIEGFVPTIVTPQSTKLGAHALEMGPLNRVAVPFISAGDLSGFDADMSYSLDVDVAVGQMRLDDNSGSGNDHGNEKDNVNGNSNGNGHEAQQNGEPEKTEKYESLPPVVPPSQPPYAEAIRRNRENRNN